MAEITLDEYLIFPDTNYDIEEALEKLVRYCKCIEGIERYFNIEFSCGDGKYLSELDDEELEKYDGNVCLLTPPKVSNTREQLKPNKWHRFTVKYYENSDREVFYLNRKETDEVYSRH